MKTFFFGSLVLIVMGAGTSRAQTYNFYTFPVTSVNGVNTSGEVVGTLTGTNSAGNSVSSGFSYSNGKATIIHAPAAGESLDGSTTIASINVHGKILGSFLRNNPKQVFGNFVLSPSETYTYFGKAIISSAESVYEAYGLNDGGEVVGTVDNLYVTSPGFKLSGGVYTYFSVPGQPSTVALGINSLGQIVGETGNLGIGPVQGFFYENGVSTVVSHPSASYTALTGINDAGLAVGYYVPTNSATFVGFTYANGLYADLPFSQLGNVHVLGINNGGEIYGSYQLGETLGGFVAVPVTDGSGGKVEAIKFPSSE